MKTDLISRRSFLAAGRRSRRCCCPDRLRRRGFQHCLFRSCFL